MILETIRLQLTHMGPSDAGFLLRLMNEPAYLKHIGDRGVRTVEDARSYLESRFSASYTKFGYGLYRVTRTGLADPIGICGLVRRESLEHPDLGFALLEEHWSRGYALEAAAAVLEHGFGPLGLRTILAVTSPANEASVRLLEKLGFAYEKPVVMAPNAGEVSLFKIERRLPA
jgi:ribosomal-protein-alanine N-acetyltransferase